MTERDLTVDDHLGSRKAPSVWDIANSSGVADRVAGSMRRAAELRKEITDADRLLTRLCERIIQNRSDALEAGVTLDYKLTRPLQAFMDAWLRGDEQERVELVTLEDAPIPPITDDNA